MFNHVVDLNTLTVPADHVALFVKDLHFKADKDAEMKLDFYSKLQEARESLWKLREINKMQQLDEEISDVRHLPTRQMRTVVGQYEQSHLNFDDLTQMNKFKITIKNDDDLFKQICIVLQLGDNLTLAEFTRAVQFTMNQIGISQEHQLTQGGIVKVFQDADKKQVGLVKSEELKRLIESL